MGVTYKCVSLDSKDASVSECSIENPPYPSCRIDGDVFLDTDISGSYTENDVVIGPHGDVYTKAEAKEKLSRLGYDPDFAKCFYVSAPACFSDLESLRLKTGAWPERFTVLASTDGESISVSLEFLIGLNNLLDKAQRPEDTWRIFNHFAHDHPYIAANFFMDRQYSVGRIGKPVGWLYDPNTVQQDAKRRYIIAIHSNILDEERRSEEGKGFVRYVWRMAGRYHLQEDHLRFIRAPVFESTLREKFEKEISQIPDGLNNELMIIYTAHGGPSEGASGEWCTILHRGVLWDTVMDERSFRKLLIDGISPKKASSILLIVESCYSGMLVEPDISAK